MDLQAKKNSSGIVFPQMQTTFLNPLNFPGTYSHLVRHGRQINVQFFDGHIDNVTVPKAQFLWPNNWRYNINHQGCPSSQF